jgi:hypothetical protein
VTIGTLRHWARDKEGKNSEVYGDQEKKTQKKYLEKK